MAVLTLTVWAGTPAGTPWKDKPWEEWDQGDVRKILYDSPWVRHFARTKRDLEFETPDPGPTGNELRGYHSKESKEDGAVTTEFYVRWVSSHTMRKAWLRRHSLLKPGTPNQGSPATLDEFELAVAGRDLSSFENVDEATLKKKSVLAISDSRKKIVPSNVQIVRSGDGKVKSLLFYFPRRTATGEPTISTHETKVWFIAHSGGVQIRVTFNPQTMVDTVGMDL